MNRFPPGRAALITLVIALLVTNAGTSSTPERAPVEAFASLPQLQSIALSPGGKYVGYLLNSAGETLLFTQDLETKKRRGITKTSNEKYVFQWLRWVSDEDLLMSIFYPDRRGGIESGESRLVSAGPNREGIQFLGMPRRNTARYEHYSQFQDRVVSDLPDDPEHILLALDLETQTLPGVYKVNVRNGNRKRVQRQREPIRHWVADQRGEVRAATGYDKMDNVYSLWVRRTGGDMWLKVTEWKAFAAPEVTPLGFGLDPGELYIRASHEGRQAIFKLDTESEQFERELMISDPRYDIEGGLVHSPRTRDVIGVRHAHAPGHVLYFDDQHADLQRAVDSALPDTHNTIIGQSRNGNVYLVNASSSTVPGKYYFGDREKHTLRVFAEDYPLLKDVELSRTQQVSITARDKLPLEAYLSLPPESNGLNLPAIIFPHGGPMARDYGGFDYWTQFFTNRGYAVLQPNFRGSSGYGFEFRMEAVQNYGGTMQDDLEDATDWLIERGIADKNRICIAGASYGGYAALMGAIKAPDKYRCVVSFAAVTDLPAIRDRARFFLGKNVIREQIGRDSEKLKETSPRYQAEKIRVPVLLAHGERDRVVPVKHGNDMARALKKAKANYIYLKLEDGSHGLTREQNRIAFFKAMDGFLAQHLPVRADDGAQ